MLGAIRSLTRRVQKTREIYERAVPRKMSIDVKLHGGRNTEAPIKNNIGPGDSEPDNDPGVKNFYRRLN